MNAEDWLRRRCGACPSGADSSAFDPRRYAYREELLGLLDRWSEDELPMSVPLKRVEQLIDEGVLQPDVLMVSPDDDRYDYHYDHDD